MSCDKVEMNARDFCTTCDLLQGEMDKCDLREELISLGYLTNQLQPKCSAAGFFTVNQLILGGLFSSVISYLIVSIQFNVSLK
ncbi:uncharacterized protein LOC126879719 [Diabrotica virgifera virgifera]|uniref:Uncharacterized protein n=1 Tax=Diabrotica virgifera virgifera TaxID=50390 RepID=A0ABM5JLS3_DIAVI|nr:uncharacterized protein LOC126879719 [Diabrotica virgifera virgifera]